MTSFFNTPMDSKSFEKFLYFITYPFRILIKLIKYLYKKSAINVNVKNLTNIEKEVLKLYYSTPLDKFVPSGQNIPDEYEKYKVIDNLCLRNILIS